LDDFIKDNPDENIIESEQTKKNVELDAELEDMLSKQRATIKVIGTGGAGNNTINRISDC